MPNTRERRAPSAAWRSPFSVLVTMCLLAVGCTAGDQGAPPDPAAPVVAPAPVEAPASAEAAPRVIVAESDPRIVRSDPERYAKAFENGPVGQPDVALPPSSASMLPIGDPGDDPPDLPPIVRATRLGTDAVSIQYRCAEGGSSLVRTNAYGGSPVTLTSTCGGLRTRTDTGLQPGTRYCYKLTHPGGTVGPSCVTTVYRPYMFNGPGISQSESDQMAAQFDWTKTDPVATSVSNSAGSQPTLYSMSILVKNVDDLYGLRGLGIHTQTAPLFDDERAAWNGNVLQAMANGKPVGVWINALVPGAIYNDVRSQAVSGLSSGHPIGIRAMVFRRLGIRAAARYPDTTWVSPVDLTYIGQMGLVFNGRAAVTCDNGNPRLCTTEQALLGWLLNKLVTIVVDVVQAAVDGVRQAIGAVERLVLGEVPITVQLVLKNSDAFFGPTEVSRSGWSGAPLVLRSLPVKVYQGVAEFAGRSDDQGRATVTVAKNLPGKVCVELDGPRVRIVDTFVEREICIGTFAATSTPRTVVVETRDPWANQLAAMTDAAQYLDTVMAFDMPKLSVLTGWQSSLLTSTNGGRSFTPCMGRMPNLAADLALAASPGLIALLGEIGEFFTAYDIILATDNGPSRGVGVHEYGHATMCEMLRRTDQVKAAVAWADVIVASLSGQDATSEQAVIAESFADFFALQVVGGTNYVAGKDAKKAGNLDYCDGAVTTALSCLEENAQRCEGSTCDFRGNVKWGVTVFQDTFDRIPASAAEQANPPTNVPNDGSHWRWDGAKLAPHHASNQVASSEGDVIQLPGPSILDIFAGWAENGSVLRYRSFFGGLAKALKKNGYGRTAACSMFAAHEPTGTCPSYFADVFPPVSFPPVVVGPLPVLTMSP
jgi:hypothetical protein